MLQHQCYFSDSWLSLLFVLHFIIKSLVQTHIIIFSKINKCNAVQQCARFGMEARSTTHHRES